MTTRQKKATTLVLPQLDIQKIKVTVKGTAPLIVNNFSNRQVLDPGPGTGRKPRDPGAQYKGSIYWIDEKKNRTGFPAVGFKASMTRGAKQVGMNMTDARSAFHVESEGTGDLIEIRGEHEMREDTVRLASGATDLRWRACYKEWEADLIIKYNAGVITAEQIVVILNAAGFGCGVGEWRPEKSKSGSFGLFEVV